MTVNSRTLLNQLAEKHCDDVFVAECKNGPTQTGSHIRLDAWVMARSWVNPCITGYEIKTTRGDFLRDDKWHLYMGLCNRFYFACPWGLIQPDEVGVGVGVMWLTKPGTRYMVKRKAEYRDVDIPESVFRYILMSRAKITGATSTVTRGQTDKEFWEKWLRTKEYNREFGGRLRGELRRVVDNEITKVNKKNIELKQVNRSLATIKDMLSALGINTEKDIDYWRARREIENLTTIIPKHLPEVVSRAIRELETLQRTISDK